jgi:hypothetical protein
LRERHRERFIQSVRQRGSYREGRTESVIQRASYREPHTERVIQRGSFRVSYRASYRDTVFELWGSWGG